jgi:hypothetical protein
MIRIKALPKLMFIKNRGKGGYAIGQTYFDNDRLSRKHIWHLDINSDRLVNSHTALSEEIFVILVN